MRISVSAPITRATRVGVSIPTDRPSAPTVWAARRVGGLWLAASTVVRLPAPRGPRR